jgi:hypothetical protein
MIKIQFNLDILLILRNRFTSELELLNQVLVRDLSCDDASSVSR